MPDDIHIQNPTVQEQIKRSQQNIKALQLALQLVEQRRNNDYSPKVPHFTGEISAYQQTIVKIHEHLDGIKKMHAEDQLSIDEYQTAVKWTREVLGIPENLVELSKINKSRAEGATISCNGQIEDLKKAIQSEEANIRRLETMGERVDDFDQRKADAAAHKESSDQPTPAEPVQPPGLPPPKTG